MKFYVEGEKGKAICSHCGDVVDSTYVRRDVPFSDGHGVAKNILVSSCDVCGEIVAIPAQSVPAIRDARREEPKSIETRLPSVFLDILDYTMRNIIESATAQHRKIFLSYYLHRFAGRKDRDLLSAHAIAEDNYKCLVDSSRRRLSLKVNSHIARDIEVLQAATHLNSTEIIKTVIYQFNHDVVERKNPEVIKQLETIAAVAG